MGTGVGWLTFIESTILVAMSLISPNSSHQPFKEGIIVTASEKQEAREVRGRTARLLDSETQQLCKDVAQVHLSLQFTQSIHIS